MLPPCPPVEVYNCAMGSPDCSQCLGREDLGHLCVWSDSCRLRGPLQSLPGTCPAPEIHAVSTPRPWRHVAPTCLACTHSALHRLSDLHTCTHPGTHTVGPVVCLLGTRPHSVLETQQ